MFRLTYGHLQVILVILNIKVEVTVHATDPVCRMVYIQTGKVAIVYVDRRISFKYMPAIATENLLVLFFS
jgi:hypothetical protein